MRWWGKVDAAKTRDELCCPKCSYSLRGVQGDVGDCPECGLRCDLAALMLKQWSGPWHRTPGFAAVLRPVAWPGIGVWVVLFAVAYEAGQERSPVIALACAVVVMAGWAWSLWRLSVRRRPHAVVSLSLLAPVILLVYLVGIISTVGFMVQAVLNVSLGAGLWVIPSLALVVAARLAERFIAKRCLRYYLIDIASAGEGPGADSG